MSTETRARTDPRNHVVQFYAHDDDLQRVVGRYLADSLRAGGTAVAATTGPHARAFDTVMVGLGEDPNEARHDGRFLTIDAADVATRLGRGGRLDADVFRGAIAEPLRRATAAGRPLFVFGEIVAILWESGQVLAALELEDRWNGLRSEMNFSLLCAYAVGSVDGLHQASALSEIGHLHSAVIGDVPDLPTSDLREGATLEEVLHLPRSPTAPKEARRFVTQTLNRWALPDLLEDGTLLVTELVANGVMHARSDLTVTVSRRAEAVRIAVHDDSLIFPIPQVPARTAASGRGITLVNAIADRWGTEVAGEGKTVWAELGTPAGSEPQSY